MPSQQVQLTAEEAILAAKLFAEVDGKAEGFRLGMEVAKSMLLKQILNARPTPPTEK